MTAARTFLEPVVAATRETLERMLSLRAVSVTPGTSPAVAPVHEVSAIVGFAGAGAQGALVLSTDRATAVALVSRLAGQELSTFDAEVADGLGELANIVAGAAKGAIRRGLVLSLPMVVGGAAHQVFETRAISNELAFFTSDAGPLCVQVHLREEAS